MTLIYKICPRGLWEDAERAGQFEGAPVDFADGYIHLSTGAQVAETAARHFAGQTDLVLVAVDAAALGSALRYESSRGGALFPHLHGILPMSAVRAVTPLPVGEDGRHAFPTLDLTEVRGGPFDPKAAGWSPMTGHDGLMALVGPIWRRDDKNGAGFGLLAEDRHMNRQHVMHGGMVMTFADQILGITVAGATSGRRQLTVQLDTHFIDAVRPGDFLEGRCEIKRQTRSLMFVQASLGVGSRLVATATGLWKVSAA